MRIFDFFTKEDPIRRCGWKIIRLYRDWKKDPYNEQCEWHDDATTEGSWLQHNVPSERIQQHFEDMVDEADRIAERPLNGRLSRLYKWVTKKATWIFSENDYGKGHHRESGEGGSTFSQGDTSEEGTFSVEGYRKIKKVLLEGRVDAVRPPRDGR